MAIITVQEAADHLRIVLETDNASPPAITDGRYADLAGKILMAEAMVLEYIALTEEDLSGSGVNANWLPVIKASVLLILSGLWDDRMGDTGGDYFAENGAVARLLRRIRYPSVA